MCRHNQCGCASRIMNYGTFDAYELYVRLTDAKKQIKFVEFHHSQFSLIGILHLMIVAVKIPPKNKK